MTADASWSRSRRGWTTETRAPPLRSRCAGDIMVEMLRVVLGLAGLIGFAYDFVRRWNAEAESARAWTIAEGIRKLRERAEAMDRPPERPNEMVGYRSAPPGDAGVVRLGLVERARQRW